MQVWEIQIIEILSDSLDDVGNTFFFFVILTDCVYIESRRPNMPYFICSIQDFKLVSWLGFSDQGSLSTRPYVTVLPLCFICYLFLYVRNNIKHGCLMLVIALISVWFCNSCCWCPEAILLHCWKLSFIRLDFPLHLVNQAYEGFFLEMNCADSWLFSTFNAFFFFLLYRKISLQHRDLQV